MNTHVWISVLIPLLISAFTCAQSTDFNDLNKINTDFNDLNKTSTDLQSEIISETTTMAPITNTSIDFNEENKTTINLQSEIIPTTTTTSPISNTSIDFNEENKTTINLQPEITSTTSSTSPSTNISTDFNQDINSTINLQSETISNTTSIEFSITNISDTQLQIIDHYTPRRYEDNSGDPQRIQHLKYETLKLRSIYDNVDFGCPVVKRIYRNCMLCTINRQCAFGMVCCSNGNTGYKCCFLLKSDLNETHETSTSLQTEKNFYVTTMDPTSDITDMEVQPFNDYNHRRYSMSLSSLYNDSGNQSDPPSNGNVEQLLQDLQFKSLPKRKISENHDIGCPRPGHILRYCLPCTTNRQCSVGTLCCSNGNTGMKCCARIQLNQKRTPIIKNNVDSTINYPPYKRHRHIKLRRFYINATELCKSESCDYPKANKEITSLSKMIQILQAKKTKLKKETEELSKRLRKMKKNAMSFRSLDDLPLSSETAEIDLSNSTETAEIGSLRSLDDLSETETAGTSTLLSLDNLPNAETTQISISISNSPKTEPAETGSFSKLLSFLHFRKMDYNTSASNLNVSSSAEDANIEATK